MKTDWFLLLSWTTANKQGCTSGQCVLLDRKQGVPLYYHVTSVSGSLQFPLGVHAAACVRVGNALGAGDTNRAFVTCKVALVLSGSVVQTAKRASIRLTHHMSIVPLISFS